LKAEIPIEKNLSVPHASTSFFGALTTGAVQAADALRIRQRFAENRHLKGVDRIHAHVDLEQSK